MKFRAGVYFILLIFLTSCSLFKGFILGETKTGAWGPIEIEPGNPSDQFFFSLVSSNDEKINADIFQMNNQLLVYPVEALKVGDIYQLEEEGNPEPIVKHIQIRKTCLVYLIKSETGSALWKNCPNEEPLNITNFDGALESYIVSRSGEWIFYIEKNDMGENEIWQIRPDGSEKKLIYDCSKSVCSALQLDAFSSKLVFIQQEKTQQIKLLDLQSGIVSIFDGTGSELNLSPNGQNIAMLDDRSGKLTIVNLDTRKRITVQSGNGLMGEWAQDSRSILFGEMEFWGGIPRVKVNELKIPSGEINPVLYDPEQELEFYQPMYTDEKDIFLASVRLRSSGAGRQFWLLGKNTEVIKQITSDPLFHYSFPGWSPDHTELVFQRFPINQSDGHPQVVVWNRDSDSFRVIAENASMPFWLH